MIRVMIFTMKHKRNLIEEKNAPSKRKVSLIFLLMTFLGSMMDPAWSVESLKLISPNDKQVWRGGETYTIKWDKANAGKYVKIKLLKAGKPYKTIRAKTKNDGKYVDPSDRVKIW